MPTMVLLDDIKAEPAKPVLPIQNAKFRADSSSPPEISILKGRRDQEDSVRPTLGCGGTASSHAAPHRVPLLEESPRALERVLGVEYPLPKCFSQDLGLV
jgi:hypothetical protein